MRFKIIKLAKTYTLQVVGLKRIYIICPIIVNGLEEVLASTVNGEETNKQCGIFGITHGSYKESSRIFPNGQICCFIY